MCVEFIGGLIKLWRVVSVGRLHTEYAVNRLLIEGERLERVEERTVEERYEREEKGGDERGIIMLAEPHFTSETDQTWEKGPPSLTCRGTATGALTGEFIHDFCCCTHTLILK